MMVHVYTVLVMYHLVVVVSACDPKDLFVERVTM
jgi:hypothetical protein